MTKTTKTLLLVLVLTVISSATALAIMTVEQSQEKLAPTLSENEAPQFVGSVRKISVDSREPNTPDAVLPEFVLVSTKIVGKELATTYYFLNGDKIELTKLIGRCAKASGSLSRPTTGVTDYNNLDVLTYTEITKTEFKNCNDYSQPVPMGKPTGELKTYTGKFVRIERPGYDIAYDYVLEFDEPQEGIPSPKGDEEGFVTSGVVAVPDSHSIWKKIEDTFGEEVKVTGYFTWGYAETNHLVVTGVSD